MAVRDLFADPPAEYSSGPLWVWNDMLTDEQITGTLRDLAAQNVRQVWVHPRPGLMTPYLSQEWYRLWTLALEEGKRLGMRVWIYDENSYPSGFAGGWVPELMPESRGRGLAMQEVADAPAWSADLVAVYRLTDAGYQNVSAQLQAGQTQPQGRYLVCRVVRAADSPWHGNRCYVDLLYPGVAEKFIEITLEPYRQRFGYLFGRQIPGTFTDEPELRPAGGFPWSEDLPKQFAKRWGYSLLDHLPCLNHQLGDYQRVRHNYLQVLNDLFGQRWGKPMHDWCEKHNLAFTGHYWEHEWPRSLMVPDNMAMYTYHQVPAIDTLCNQYAEHTHAQFGNVRAVRELQSVANQLGRTRTLCEAYGAGGWDMRFEDMKRIGDWLYVLGVNTLNQHLSYVTIRGARKRDHPLSFSYHAPWWEAYKVQADYFARLSVALSAGKQVNRVLLLQPTTSAWMHHTHDQNDPRLSEIGATFFQTVMDLERHQIAYDIGSEDILARFGSATSGKLTVGERTYDVVVLPPLTENLNSPTLALLRQHAQAGGAILSCVEPPARIDGQASDNAKTALGSSPGWQRVEPADLPAKLKPYSEDGLAIHRADSDPGILFHHRRRLADGDLLFLVNTSTEHPSTGGLDADMGGIEQWDPATGQTRDYPFQPLDGKVKTHFELPPCGSLLLFLSHEKRHPLPATICTPRLVQRIAGTAHTAPAITRRDPNVLTLDYVDVTAGGETRENLYVYPAGQFAFQKNGMERNPWDSAVQFRDELITKRFAPDSGCEVTYRFTIEGPVPGDLNVVVERPDLYRMTFNGRELRHDGRTWWLDRVFGRMPVAPLAHTGENVLTLKAAPFTIYHEIEAAYVLGDFGLKATDKGFVIVAEPTLQLGPWKDQGMPFYSAGVSYTERFDLPNKKGRYLVSLNRWYGAVAVVTVNGSPAGCIQHAPWQCDVTAAIQTGTNEIDVKVIGTLKNTLGPHHNNPPLGAAWPGAFHHAPNPGPPPGSQYSVVGYGLFEPFLLLEENPQPPPMMRK